MRAPVRTGGFTLVELHVVIAIIALLIGLLLPAVQSARETARLLTCKNHARNVATAVGNHESSQGSLPVGAYSCCWGTWLAAVLPYIEQQALFDLYVWEGRYDQPDSSFRYSGSRNRPVTTQHVEIYKCPADAASRTTLGGFNGITRHNYVVNLGTTGHYVIDAQTTSPVVEQVNGVRSGKAPFSIEGGPNQPHLAVQAASIRDGLSNTLMLSEVIQGEGTDLRGFSWWGFAAGFSTYLAPNTNQPDVMQGGNYCGNSANRPPCIVPHSRTMPMMQAARSRHAGGVITARCDGSVHWMSDDVFIGVWRALGTSAGGESESLP